MSAEQLHGHGIRVPACFYAWTDAQQGGVFLHADPNTCFKATDPCRKTPRQVHSLATLACCCGPSLTLFNAWELAWFTRAAMRSIVGQGQTKISIANRSHRAAPAWHSQALFATLFVLFKRQSTATLRYTTSRSLCQVINGPAPTKNHALLLVMHQHC